jgi:hypothetical protein
MSRIGDVALYFLYDDLIAVVTKQEGKLIGAFDEVFCNNWDSVFFTLAEALDEFTITSEAEVERLALSLVSKPNSS